MNALKSRVDQVVQELRSEAPDLRNELKKKAWERLADCHTDHELMDPFPIPLIIIGTKYDLFQVNFLFLISLFKTVISKLQTIVNDCSVCLHHRIWIMYI